MQIVSLTELMAGVKAPVRNVQLFQLTCWPMGHKVRSTCYFSVPQRERLARLQADHERAHSNRNICTRSTGAHLDQFLGGADEHGGAVAREDRIRSSVRRIPVSN